MQCILAVLCDHRPRPCQRARADLRIPRRSCIALGFGARDQATAGERGRRRFAHEASQTPDHCGPRRMPASNRHSAAATKVPSRAWPSLIKMPAANITPITTTGRSPHRSARIKDNLRNSIIRSYRTDAYSLCPFLRNASVRRSFSSSAALRPMSCPICVVCCASTCDLCSNFCPTGRR